MLLVEATFAAGAHDRALWAGRHDRHRRAIDRAMAVGAARPAIRHREPARAATNIATAAVVRAPPDGYAFLLTPLKADAGRSGGRPAPPPKNRGENPMSRVYLAGRAAALITAWTIPAAQAQHPTPPAPPQRPQIETKKVDG